MVACGVAAQRVISQAGELVSKGWGDILVGIEANAWPGQETARSAARGCACRLIVEQDVYRARRRPSVLPRVGRAKAIPSAYPTPPPAE